MDTYIYLYMERERVFFRPLCQQFCSISVTSSTSISIYVFVFLSLSMYVYYIANILSLSIPISIIFICLYIEYLYLSLYAYLSIHLLIQQCLIFIPYLWTFSNFTSLCSPFIADVTIVGDLETSILRLLPSAADLLSTSLQRRGGATGWNDAI